MKISVNIYLFPVALAVFFTGQFELYAIAYFFAFLHECAHILTAKSLNLQVEKVEFLPVGFAAKIRGVSALSVKEELILLISGPAANLVFFIFTALICKTIPSLNTEVLSSCISVNIILACFNMLPIIPLDGGRIFLIMLSLNMGILKCARFCTVFSKILNIFLLFISICIFIITGSFIMIIVVCYILFLLFGDNENITADSFLYILNKKNLIKTNKVVPLKPAAAAETTSLINILREIDRKNVMIITVFDNDNKMVGILDEYRILAHVLNKGLNFTVGELL